MGKRSNLKRKSKVNYESDESPENIEEPIRRKLEISKADNPSLDLHTISPPVTSAGKGRKELLRNPSESGIEPVYDPDFSEESSEAEPESNDGWLPPRVDFDKIPRWLLHDIEISPGRFKWECPDCPWFLDLLQNPPGHPLHNLNWQTPNDTPVKQFLIERVNGHYDDHLWDCGFKWFERKGRKYIMPIEKGEMRARAEGSHYTKGKEYNDDVGRLKPSIRITDMQRIQNHVDLHHVFTHTVEHCFPSARFHRRFILPNRLDSRVVVDPVL
ncbi:hypothetical protein BKA70DRAFT_1218487 [Coprinopsis sp. MPI-PUGE-AT-0042]|nr:hypothetical protein BKA70DRAFT_1218487 [Coprinopsis sp. MPI-PUGE-AT-0042]